MGLEGIVSKRLGSRYRSGRSPDWIKLKNPGGTCRQTGGGGGLGQGTLAMTVLTLRRIREDRFEVTGARHRACNIQNPSGGARLVPYALPGLANSRRWRPQHTEGNGGYG